MGGRKNKMCITIVCKLANVGPEFIPRISHITFTRRVKRLTRNEMTVVGGTVVGSRGVTSLTEHQKEARQDEREMNPTAHGNIVIVPVR